jgi:hypothetical protein
MLPLILVLLQAGSQAPSPKEEALGQLLIIRRVYVDRLTGGETAAQMRAAAGAAQRRATMARLERDRTNLPAASNASTRPWPRFAW